MKGNKGQIVEILPDSPLYKAEKKQFLNRREALECESKRPKYGLFDGMLIGGHDGVENYKIGQRKGLDIGGKKEPLYIIDIDEKENRIFVGAGKNHPGLFTKALFIPNSKIEWFENIDYLKKNSDTPVKIHIVIKGKEEVLQANLYQYDDGYFVEFERYERALPKHLILEIYFNKNNKAASAVL